MPFTCLGLLASFPEYVQTAIKLDFLSFTKTSYISYTRYGFMTLLRFAEQNNLPVSVLTVKRFSQHLQLNNKSPAQAQTAFGCLKIVLAAFNITISPQDYQLYKARVRSHSKAFSARPEKKFRYPISLHDMNKLWFVKPNGCPRSSWQNFITLAWVFMLRNKEILAVNPSDLCLRYDESGTAVGWSLVVRNNKNCANKLEGRAVFFRFCEIPRQFHNTLLEISQTTSRNHIFRKLPSSQKIIHHLRSVLFVDKTFSIVIHSFRHGRPEYLVNVLGYSEGKLMKVARWSTQKGRRAYQHS